MDVVGNSDGGLVLGTRHRREDDSRGREQQPQQQQQQRQQVRRRQRGQPRQEGSSQLPGIFSFGTDDDDSDMADVWFESDGKVKQPLQRDRLGPSP